MAEAKTRRAGMFGDEQRGEQLQLPEFDGSRCDAMPEPCSFDSTTARRFQAFNAAVAWRRRNPHIWAAWERDALHEAEQGRRVSMRFFAETARKFDSVDDAGEPFEVNNSHVAIFARMLVAEHPELRPFIELRRSVWDSLFTELAGGRHA